MEGEHGNVDPANLSNYTNQPKVINKLLRADIVDRNDNFLEYQYRSVAKRVKGVKTNLTAMGKAYNIEHDYDKLHNALVDLELNLKVWNKLKHQIDL